AHPTDRARRIAGRAMAHRPTSRVRSSVCQACSRRTAGPEVAEGTRPVREERMTQQYESIRVEKRDRVTTVVLSRPERRNAVDGPMARELASAFRAFDADEESDV